MSWMDKLKKASKGVVDAGAKTMLKVGTMHATTCIRILVQDQSSISILMKPRSILPFTSSDLDEICSGNDPSKRVCVSPPLSHTPALFFYATNQRLMSYSWTVKSKVANKALGLKFMISWKNWKTTIPCLRPRKKQRSGQSSTLLVRTLL